MKFLCLFSPILSAVLVTILTSENILYHYDNPFIHYRYCSNSPISSKDVSKFADYSASKIFTCLYVLSSIAELGSHILIYVKKTQIESRAQVYEIRGNQLVSQMRHQRNMVSIFGHFLTFSVILARNMVFVINFYIVTDGTLLIKINCLLHFMDPCIVFFICPLIETLTSSTLRDSLFSM